MCMSRANRDNDVTIRVLYCGICRSDLESARNEFGFTIYPFVPGLVLLIINITLFFPLFWSRTRLGSDLCFDQLSTFYGCVRVYVIC